MPESAPVPILNLRGLPVLIDADLARLYGVPTKRLNEQVRRNQDRFPADFLFELTPEEKAEVVANCDHLRNLKFPALVTKLRFVTHLSAKLCVDHAAREERHRNAESASFTRFVRGRVR